MADVAFQYTVSPPPAHETLQQKKLRQRESFKLRRLEHKLRLFQEAVHIARTREEGQDAASWEVTFAINFPTHFGQNLFVVGSCPELGAWSAENAIELEWGPNHVWSGTVKLPRNHGTVEYKYLVKQHNESNWEWGQNHVVSFDSKLGTQAVVDAWGMRVERLSKAAIGSLIPFIERQADRHHCLPNAKSRDRLMLILESVQGSTLKTAEDHLSRLVLLGPWLFPQMLPLPELQRAASVEGGKSQLWERVKTIIHRKRVQPEVPHLLTYKNRSEILRGPLLLELAVSVWNVVCLEVTSASNEADLLSLFRAWTKGATLLGFVSQEVMPHLPSAVSTFRPATIRDARILLLALATGVSYSQSVDFSHSLRAKLAHHVVYLLSQLMRADEGVRLAAECLLPIFTLLEEANGVLEQYAECQKSYRGLGPILARVYLVETFLEKITKLPADSRIPMHSAWWREAVAIGSSVVGLRAKMDRENRVIFLEIVPTKPPALFNDDERPAEPLSCTFGTLPLNEDFAIRRTVLECLSADYVSLQDRAAKSLQNYQETVLDPTWDFLLKLTLHLPERRAFPTITLVTLRGLGGSGTLLQVHKCIERKIRKGQAIGHELTESFSRLLKVSDRIHLKAAAALASVALLQADISRLQSRNQRLSEFCQSTSFVRQVLFLPLDELRQYVQAESPTAAPKMSQNDRLVVDLRTDLHRFQRLLLHHVWELSSRGDSPKEAEFESARARIVASVRSAKQLPGALTDSVFSLPEGSCALTESQLRCAIQVILNETLRALFDREVSGFYCNWLLNLKSLAVALDEDIKSNLMTLHMDELHLCSPTNLSPCPSPIASRLKLQEPGIDELSSMLFSL